MLKQQLKRDQDLRKKYRNIKIPPIRTSQRVMRKSSAKKKHVKCQKSHDISGFELPLMRVNNIMVTV